jgi:hypothetical protein
MRSQKPIPNCPTAKFRKFQPEIGQSARDFFSNIIRFRSNDKLLIAPPSICSRNSVVNHVSRGNIDSLGKEEMNSFATAFLGFL